VFDAEAFNRGELRVVEMAAANGTGTARAVAKLYGAAATGAADLGLSREVCGALEAPAVAPTGVVRDRVMFTDMSYSLGFGKPTSRLVFGSSGKAFGWMGAGGSFGFADPDTGTGFGYVPNKMGLHVHSDPRELKLRQALFRDVLCVPGRNAEFRYEDPLTTKWAR
jgi:CubicO group peptidase (beta-lactamase class C family)